MPLPGETREHELEMEERRRVQSAVESLTLPDPVTGKRRLSGTGSGFYVGQNGEILTNEHVVNRCTALTATADDDAKQGAVLVARASPDDIALLRTAKLPRSVARFRLHLGDRVQVPDRTAPAARAAGSTHSNRARPARRTCALVR